MSSSSDKFTQSRKTQKQMFLKVSGRQICAPQRDIIMASPYKALSIWVKRFFAYELRQILGEAFCIFIFFHFPDSEHSV